MAWLAESLGTKASETPDETIRRYIADKFFKDHLQTYKKRPIYWLFSSGKQGAFQALVYLHRYHEGTLARLRAEYVVPLTGKIQSRIEMLQKDAAAASSTAARNKLAKEVEKLKKKHVELLAYDEQLRHYADMRITLDLDDGVKVNYGKFGDLLDRREGGVLSTMRGCQTHEPPDSKPQHPIEALLDAPEVQCGGRADSKFEANCFLEGPS
jgi:hypothetical protein